jgi:nitrogen fixation protein FixH
MADKNMKEMPGMADMPSMRGMGDPTREGSNADHADKGQGMDTSAPPVQTPGKTPMRESMINMPMATPKRTWTVTGTEDWAMLRGFGQASGMVGMMNSMMVGGSPMQNMKMGKMDMKMAEMPASSPEEARTASDGMAAPAEAAASTASITFATTPNPPVVGDNTLDVTVTDAAGKPITGLKLATTVAMVSMDMGTAHPPVTETGGGHYAATVNFSMAGLWRVVVQGDGGKLKGNFDFQAGGKASPSQPADAHPQGSQNQAPHPVPDQTPGGPMTVAASLSPNPPKVGGSNTLTVTVTDVAGKPVPGAKVKSSVAMTTMDMGTTHPAFKDIGGGKYEGKVGFSMAGPWRVSVKVTAPGQKPQSKTFDFTAK